MIKYSIVVGYLKVNAYVLYSHDIVANVILLQY